MRKLMVFHTFAFETLFRPLYTYESLKYERNFYQIAVRCSGDVLHRENMGRCASYDGNRRKDLLRTRHFVKHLDEVFTDSDEIHDFTCGCEILDINLYKHYHQYSFARHELKGDAFHIVSREKGKKKAVTRTA